jgi:site-specific DNA-methyltransferase (adenine-specific)
VSAIVHADCRDALALMEPASVDALVTDPPYGLSFMGEGWDRQVPGPEFWAAALRVAKPGARLVAFGGTRTAHRLGCAIEDAGWIMEDSLAWLFGQGWPKAKSKLKPAHEPIYLARAPGPIAELEIDACRTATHEDLNGGAYSGELRARPMSRLARGIGEYEQPPGRWPANVLLGCACESEHEPDCAVVMLDAQSGSTGSHGRSGAVSYEHRNVVYGSFSRHSAEITTDHTGGASRFFYTAKATRAEREAGVEHRASEGRRGNAHPTVKPVALMRWLVRLVAKPGARLVDPFCGSGTTGVACALERMEFVGIDVDATSCETARARFLAAAEEAGTASAGELAAVPDRVDAVQLGLFGGYYSPTDKARAVPR